MNWVQSWEMDWIQSWEKNWVPHTSGLRVGVLHSVFPEFYTLTATFCTREAAILWRRRLAGVLRAFCKTCGSPLLHRFRMNGHPRNLRKFLLHAVLKRSRHVVDLRNRQAALHRAVAGSQNLVF